MSKKVTIIGSGFSGLSTACYLAKQGCDVTVLEKHDSIGGRARKFEQQGFVYDMGPSWYWMPDVFDKFFADFGKKVSDYYDLALTDETSRYVFRILALKEIMKSPEKYGFNLFPSDLYESIPSKRIVVDSTINDLADFAKTQGINYKILKIHNPWLRDRKLENPTNKKYEIEIPLEGY